MTGHPGFGALIRMPAGGFEALPDMASPYYVGSKDGLFAARKLLFGHGVARLTHWPDNFEEVGAKDGKFVFTADPIPGKLMAQIVHFFRRIYEKQKTEAAVLLTMHRTTKEWGVFIPTQLVSHGGVNYVFDPAHIAQDQIVVGSIHSHCDFSAFHSGTDTGDAADFDGFHATVGFIMRDIPQIVAMVSLNKQFLHYGQEAFPALFDYTELWQHEAPEWWDRYVGPNSGSEKPVGYELYKKFEKPTTIKSHTTSGGVGAQQWVPGTGWSPINHAGPTSQWWEAKTPEWLKENGYRWVAESQSMRYFAELDETRKQWGYQPSSYSAPIKESQEFNARRTKAEKKEQKRRFRSLTNEEKLDLEASFYKTEFWEDGLDDDLVEAISNANILTEDEWDAAFEHPAKWSDVSEWKQLMVEKLFAVVGVLLEMDVPVSVKLGDHADSQTITGTPKLLSAGDQPHVQ